MVDKNYKTYFKFKTSLYVSVTLQIRSKGSSRNFAFNIE